MKIENLVINEQLEKYVNDYEEYIKCKQEIEELHNEMYLDLDFEELFEKSRVTEKEKSTYIKNTEEYKKLQHKFIDIKVRFTKNKEIYEIMKILLKDNEF